MKSDVINSLQKSLEMLDVSMNTALKTIPLIKDVDPSISKDIQNLVNLSKGTNNSSVEAVVNSIIKKNENKLKDLDNVTGSK